MPKCPFCREHKDTGAGLQEHIDLKHPEEAIDVGISRRQQQKRIKSKRKRPLVIDGDCIAILEGGPSVVVIKKVRSALVKQGFTPIIYVSSKLSSSIDDDTEYQRLINLRWINETDDLLNSMVETAIRKKCSILSNEPYGKEASRIDTEEWKIKKSLIKFTYDDGTFVFN